MGCGVCVGEGVGGGGVQELLSLLECQGFLKVCFKKEHTIPLTASAKKKQCSASFLKGILSLFLLHFMKKKIEIFPQLQDYCSNSNC